MDRPFVSIGMDIGKAQLDLYNQDTGESISFANDASGIALLLDWLDHVDLIVCEPTGGYERLVVRTLQHAGVAMALVDPWRVRSFARALGIAAKTDRMDAILLAQYGMTLRPKPSTHDAHATLKALVVRRRQVIELQKQTKQHKEGILDQEILIMIEDTLEHLQDQITQLDASIQRYILANPDTKNRYDILTSCRGVGDVTAATLIAELPELGTLSHPQIAALVGGAPLNHDSGNTQGKRRIRGGRKTVRNVLYMAALVATRYNTNLKQIYERLKKNGKPPKLAITAIMRKLIITLNALLRDNRKWKEQTINAIT